jgi:hypothetical protein
VAKQSTSEVALILENESSITFKEVCPARINYPLHSEKMLRRCSFLATRACFLNLRTWMMMNSRNETLLQLVLFKEEGSFTHKRLNTINLLYHKIDTRHSKLGCDDVMGRLFHNFAFFGLADHFCSINARVSVKVCIILGKNKNQSVTKEEKSRIISRPTLLHLDRRV